jgi:hypothetical protein
MGLGLRATTSAGDLLALGLALGAMSIALPYWESTSCAGHHHDSGLFKGALCDNATFVDGEFTDSSGTLRLSGSPVPFAPGSHTHWHTPTPCFPS